LFLPIVHAEQCQEKKQNFTAANIYLKRHPAKCTR
jgi:hypothetical protein